MAVIKSVRGYTPKIGKGTMVAENATIVGNVEIGEESSIWFGAIIRGDVNAIRIGKRCNDHCDQSNETHQKSKQRHPGYLC